MLQKIRFKFVLRLWKYILSYLDLVSRLLIYRDEGCTFRMLPSNVTRQALPADTDPAIYQSLGMLVDHCAIRAPSASWETFSTYRQLYWSQPSHSHTRLLKRAWKVGESALSVVWQWNKMYDTLILHTDWSEVYRIFDDNSYLDLNFPPLEAFRISTILTFIISWGSSSLEHYLIRTKNVLCSHQTAALKIRVRYLRPLFYGDYRIVNVAWLRTKVEVHFARQTAPQEMNVKQRCLRTAYKTHA